MAMGKAVVATATGGLPEVVAQGETGLLVPPGDVESLAATRGVPPGRPRSARADGP